jgi:hypothetical protein
VPAAHRVPQLGPRTSVAARPRAPTAKVTMAFAYLQVKMRGARGAAEVARACAVKFIDAAIADQ